MLDRTPQPEFTALPEMAAGDVASIDRQILFLLSQRFALARTLGDGAWDDDEERRAAMAVIRRKAFELGVPVSLVSDFWDRLSDASIAVRDQASRK